MELNFELLSNVRVAKAAELLDAYARAVEVKYPVMALALDELEAVLINELSIRDLFGARTPGPQEYSLPVLERLKYFELVAMAGQFAEVASGFADLSTPTSDLWSDLARGIMGV